MKRQKNLLSNHLFCICIQLFFLSMFKPSLVWADQYSGVDFREKFFRNDKVCHNKSAITNVDIPEHFLQSHDKIIIVIEVESNTYTTGDSKKQSNFKLFRPYLRINGARVFGNHFVPVKFLPQTQTHEIEIKRKYLKVGLNTFEAIYNWRNNKSSCRGKCCGYTINEMYFKDAPPLIYTLSVSSTPSDARIYLDGEYSGTTPKNIEVSKGWHNIRIEKDGFEILTDDFKIYDENKEYSCVLKKNR